MTINDLSNEDLDDLINHISIPKNELEKLLYHNNHIEETLVCPLCKGENIINISLRATSNPLNLRCCNDCGIVFKPLKKNKKTL